MIKKSDAAEWIEEKYIKRIYHQIMLMAFLVHASYVIIFAIISYSWMSIYNIGSAFFYLALLFLVQKGFYRFAVAATHLEVCLFVIICTLLGGWELGISFYLMALSSLVYFCPFDRRYIPYLFSIFEIGIFIILKLYTNHNTPCYPSLSLKIHTCLYLYNIGACFAFILYTAFLTNVSATVTKKKLQEENEDLNERVNHDQLTGLLSRYSFFQKMEESDDDDAIIALGDIDNFKRINDTYGHFCGDFILEEISKLMMNYCSKQAYICRWGGEEFLFFFHNISFDEAKMRMQKLCKIIADYSFIYGKQKLRVTMTFGICMDKKKEGYQKKMIEQADKLMYQGKNQGKNQVVSSMSKEVG